MRMNPTKWDGMDWLMALLVIISLLCLCQLAILGARLGVMLARL